jgi:hypothetical protein
MPMDKSSYSPDEIHVPLSETHVGSAPPQWTPRVILHGQNLHRERHQLLTVTLLALNMFNHPKMVSANDLRARHE